MRLSTKGRYAVMAMADLARRQAALAEGDRAVTLAEIAARQQISLSYLEQLFGKLRRDKLVDSVRGPGGGYCIARPLDRVTVADIIRAVDEPLDATQCGGRENCRDEQRCMTHDLWTSLNDRMIELLYKSAPLHDIGKIGIPDSILLKPGKLTVEEFEVMKTHTTLGRNAIEEAERRLGMRVAFLSVSKEIAYSHQEKWDGSGYPQGLKGDAIPVSARLMAVADVYDALISKRVYKPAFSHDQAAGTIVRGKGTYFDPDMVDAFVDIAEDFRNIAQKYPDPG